MERARRIVTGVNAAGRSAVISEDYLPAPSTGSVAVTIFSSDPSTTVPLRELTAKSVNPREQPAFATTWRIIQFPPADSPNTHTGNMHTTPTIDYLAIRAGELTMLLDDGVEVVLRPGDYLIQGGVAHGWLNRGSVPCIAECLIVGLPREDR